MYSTLWRHVKQKIHNVDVGSMMNIGNRLKYLRLDVLKKSQVELAKLLGVQSTAISNYEKNVRNMPDSIKELLNVKFNVNIHWLETGEGKPFEQKHDTACVKEIKAFPYESSIIHVDQYGQRTEKERGNPPPNKSYPIEFAGIIDAGEKSIFETPKEIRLPVSMLIDIPEAYKYWVVDGKMYGQAYEDMDVIITRMVAEIENGMLVVYDNKIMNVVFGNHGTKLLIEHSNLSNIVKLPAIESFDVIVHLLRSF